MNFGQALELLKKGEKVARSGWNGKGMWLCLVDNWFYGGKAAEYTAQAGQQAGPDVVVQGLPWIGMKTADNKFVPWLTSQTDVLAEDWMVLS